MQRTIVPNTRSTPDVDELAVTLDRLAAGFSTLSVFLLKPPTAQVLDQVREPELLSQWPCHPCLDREAGIKLVAGSTGELVALNAKTGAVENTVNLGSPTLISPIAVTAALAVPVRAYASNCATWASTVAASPSAAAIWTRPTVARASGRFASRSMRSACARASSKRRRATRAGMRATARRSGERA